MRLSHPPLRTMIHVMNAAHETTNQMIRGSQNMKNIYHNAPEAIDRNLMRGATLCGQLGIPEILPPKWLPSNPVFVPFSHRERRVSESTIVCFYESDENFKDVVDHPERYIDDFSRFGAVTSPDCSMYRDAPLSHQISNLYLGRRAGSYLQRHGINILPHIRWGSRETFTTSYFPERIAFLGIRPHTDVAVSTYGCFHSRRDKQLFVEGFDEMIRVLQPRRIFLYGAMPKSFYAPSLFESATQTQCIHCPDWISHLHGKGK